MILEKNNMAIHNVFMELMKYIDQGWAIAANWLDVSFLLYILICYTSKFQNKNYFIKI